MKKDIEIRSDEGFERLLIAMYRQAELDIEDMLVGRKIEGETIYSVLDFVSHGPFAVSPERFLQGCIERRMQLSRLKKMPAKWKKYIEYAEGL